MTTTCHVKFITWLICPVKSVWSSEYAGGTHTHTHTHNDNYRVHQLNCAQLQIVESMKHIRQKCSSSCLKLKIGENATKSFIYREVSCRLND